MTALPQKVAENKMNAILCDLEAGRIETAEKDLAALLMHHPFTPFTPLAGFYLQQIRGEPVQITIPPRGADRYASVEVSLDEADVERQIEEAGPVEAPQPKSPGTEESTTGATRNP
jgi:hypothetical protein